MIAAAIKSSIAVLDGRMYKGDKQVRERKKGTKLVFSILRVRANSRKID